MPEPTQELIIKATGDNESREFHVSKLDNGNIQVKLWWGRGSRDLATLNFTPEEWAKLVSGTAGLVSQ